MKTVNHTHEDKIADWSFRAGLVVGIIMGAIVYAAYLSIHDNSHDAVCYQENVQLNEMEQHQRSEGRLNTKLFD